MPLRCSIGRLAGSSSVKDGVIFVLKMVFTSCLSGDSKTMFWMCFRWFVTFYHGKSPFFTTIWEDFWFLLFPSIKQANLRCKCRRDVRNASCVNVSIETFRPQSVRHLCIAEIAVYGHQQNEQNDRNNKCQITSMFSRIVFFLSFTLFCNQSLCVLFGEPFKNCGGWTSAPGTFETLIPANSSHQQYQFWCHVSIQLRHLMFGVLVNIRVHQGVRRRFE